MQAAFATTALVVEEDSLASTVQTRNLLRIADALRIPRVVRASGRGGAPRLRLLSANPDYPAYVCRTDDVHIVGEVLWKVTRA